MSDVFSRSMKDLPSPVQKFQCHTFTKCLLCTVVPPRFTIDDLCTRPESHQAHSYFSLGDDTEEKPGGNP